MQAQFFLDFFCNILSKNKSRTFVNYSNLAIKISKHLKMKLFNSHTVQISETIKMNNWVTKFTETIPSNLMNLPSLRVFLLALGIVYSFSAVATVYYNKSGVTEFNNITNWTDASSGTGGNTATSFTTGGPHTFTIRANTTMSLSADFSSACNITVASSGTLDLNGFTLSSGIIALNVSGVGNSSAGAIMNGSSTGATCQESVTLAASSTFIATSGGMTFSGGFTGNTFGITVGGSYNTTISGVIGTTSGTLTKNGSGILTLSGANTYTGITTVAAGTLKLGANGSGLNGPLGTTSANTSITAGAVLDLNGFTLVTSEPLTLNGTGLTALAAGALTNTGGNATYSGNITLGSLGATITATTSGTLTCSGNVTGNTFALTLDGAIGSTGIMSGAVQTTTGTVTKNGAGTWTFGNAASNYTGLTSISAGTLKLGASSTATTGPLGNVSGATSVTEGASLDMNGFSLTSSATEPLTINGIGVSSFGALTNSSSTASTFIGAITLASASEIEAASGNISLTGAINNAGFLLTVDGSNAVNIGTAVMSGAGGLTKNGTGTLTVNGAHTFTGAITVNNGIYKLGSAGTAAASGPLGTNAGGTTVASGASLDLNGQTFLTTEALTINGSGVSSLGALTNSSTTVAVWPGTVALNDPTNNYIGTSGNSTSGTLTVSGLISGSNPLQIVNTGATASSVILSNGGSTYSGVTTVVSGTLKLGVSGTSPNGPLGTTTGGTNVNSGACLDLNAITLATSEGLIINGTGISSAGALTNSSTTAVTWSGTVSLGDATNNYIGTSGNATTGILTVSGIISGSNPVQITHTGTTKSSVVFSNTSNSYTGTTTILSGTLKLGAAGVIPNSNAVTVTGTLDLASYSEEVGSIAGGGIITTSIAGACALTCGGDNSSTTYSGSFTVGSGTPALIKTGTGTLTLSGASTYTGTTTISQGIIKLGASSTATTGPLGNVSAGTTVSSGASLDMNGFSLTSSATESLTINGIGVSSFGALTNSSSTAATFVGAITLASASEIEAASGNISLTGAINNAGFLLTVDGSNAVNIGTAVMSGAGGLTKNGTGTLTVNGLHTFTGAVTINNGIYKLGSAGTASASGPLGTNAGGTTVASGASLDLNGQTVLTTEAVTINGTGYSSNGAIFNNTGTGTFPGAITLGSASTIEDLGTSLTLTGGITNAGNDLTFGGTGVVIVSTNKITGAGGLIKSDAGTMRLSISSDYSGTTTLNSGRLENGASNVFPNTQLILNGGTYANALSGATSTAYTETFGTLQLNASSTIDFATNSAMQDLNFSASNGLTWLGTLTISDWQGTAGNTGTKGQIFVGSSNTGLSTSQLDQISLTVSSNSYLAAILSSGEVVPSNKPFITSFPSTFCHSTNSLIITGNNFTGTTAVSIGGVNVSSFVVNSTTQISATVSSVMSGTISVTNASGTTVSTSEVSAILCSNSLNVPSSNSSVITCGVSTKIYDSGGSGSNYSNSTNGYLVLDNSGSGVITLTGSYVTEVSYDNLYIYRGEGTSGTLVGTYNGTGNLPTITSTAGQPLTIKFTSDSGNDCSGFSISAVYSGTCASPTISSFTPSYGCVNTTDVVITGTNFYGTSAVTIGGVSVSSFTINSGTQITARVAGASTGNIVVTTPNGIGTSASVCTVASCASNIVPSSSYSMIPCGTNTIVYDNGGASSNYVNHSNGYLVLDNSGTGVITLSGTYAIETTYDNLYIYRGEGTLGTLVGTYNGTGSIPTITSTAGQPLTIKFTSDGGTNMSGFSIAAVYSGLCSSPTITSFTPTGGCANTSSLEILGTNLTGATVVSIGGVNVSSFSVVSSTKITAVAGAAGSGVISVTTPNGIATSSTNCIIPECSANSIPTSGSSTISCGTNAIIYDNGGVSGNYSNNADGYIVIENSSSLYITLTGTYNTEATYDLLRFYRGVGTGGTQINSNYSGSGSIPTITSNVGEAITVRFTSDGSGASFSGLVISAVYSEYSISLSSAAGTNSQTVNQSSPITNITYNTIGATGASVSGLPSGVTGSWTSNVFTITGTPSQVGVFNYTITLSGGCGAAVTKTGTITVTTGPEINIVQSLVNFTACKGVNSTSQNFTVSGANMAAGITITPPVGYEVSSASNFATIGTNASPITVGAAGTIASTTIYVRTTTTATHGATGNIVCSSTNATSQNVNIPVATINQPTTSITITGNTATLANGDYLWNGSASTNVSVLGNWYKMSSGTFIIADQAPTSSDRVFIVPHTVAVSCVSNSNSPIIAASGSLTSGNVYIESGASLSLGASSTFSVAGDFMNYGTVNLTDGTVTFSGSASKVIGGTGTTTFNNLTINKTSGGGVSLSNDISVNGTLTLTEGVITLGSKNLTIGNSGSISVTSPSSSKMINTSGTGELRKHYAQASNQNPGAFLYPVGTTGEYTPVSLDFADVDFGSDAYTKVRIQNTKNNLMSGSVTSYIDRTWIVEPSADVTGYEYSIDLHYVQADLVLTNGLVESELQPVKRSNGQWYQPDVIASTFVNATKQGNPNIDDVNNVLSWGQLTTFSEFGGAGGDNVPLPVELLSFTGNCLEEQVSLEWKTVSEHNSAYFDVEKSRDGENWTLLTTVPAAGNSVSLLTYNAIDANPTSENNYYRLKQVDIDGQFKVYNVINVTCVETTKGYMSSYPNPSGDQFQVVINDTDLIGKGTMNILDSKGTLITKLELELKDGINMFVINKHFESGIYFINYTVGKKSTKVLKHIVR